MDVIQPSMYECFLFYQKENIEVGADVIVEREGGIGIVL